MMHDIPINLMALLAATAIRFIVGAIWFSPVAFAPAWRGLVGIDEARMKAGLPKAIIIDLIGSFVMAFVLVHAVIYAGASTIAAGAAVGFFNWLGFVAVVQLGANIYQQRPLTLFFVETGFNLLALILMGAVLAVWH
jgi:Protein of unknown function (DUF1761)